MDNNQQPLNSQPSLTEENAEDSYETSENYVDAEQELNELVQRNEELEFFSNQIEVNKTLFNGFKLILEKLSQIEEKLNGKS